MKDPKIRMTWSHEYGYGEMDTVSAIQPPVLPSMSHLDYDFVRFSCRRIANPGGHSREYLVYLQPEDAGQRPPTLLWAQESNMERFDITIVGSGPGRS